MSGITITLSVANTLLAALSHPLIKYTLLSFSYSNKRLKKLKRSVSAVKNVLLDAANQAELSEVDRECIEKLKDAIYEADDMFDELLTQLQRMQLFGDENIAEKVRHQLLPSVKNEARFGLSIDIKPHRTIRTQTLSYSNSPGVVGRDKDARKVIDMLLNSTKYMYYLAIVGIGGVGKTTLAKLVFDDMRIIDEFPIRLWVCASDQHGAMLDVKQILLNILESLKLELYDSLSVEYLQLEYKRNLKGKKFLLVLDDIWSENIIELRNLKELLMIQGSVSRIIATTRSKETARMIGNDTHLLEGLSGEHSRRLFDEGQSIESASEFKDAVYNADDIFDTLVTMAKPKQHFDNDNIVKMVHHLLLPSVKRSLQVKKLRSRLNNIADDHAKFGLSISTEPHKRFRVETFSNVYAPGVIGRHDDANKVIGMLLDLETCVYFLAIVGIGGVGKTTLAKLVFSEKRITDEFPTRLWVCVSDQDGETLDVKQILLKILESLECCGFDSSSSVDSLQREYQCQLQGRKFLLVLDDIWSEKIRELDNLKNLLKIDGSKGRIIATTRSKETARIMGNTHELEGLSDEHSRSLFEMVAFQDGEKPPELVVIGEKIVKKSCNVPLAIMVIGSLLYCQPIDKWQTFLMSGFNSFSKGMDEIMSILKISYDNLDPSLRSCFAYCAIFPKDYVIRKEVIINLWDAQGYIIPFDEGQSIENAGEEHFSVLLQRCFFQDVNKNEWGDVVSFKIHDLMHSLAQKVSGNEICVINSSLPYPESVRHIFSANSTPFLSIPYNLLHGEPIDHSIAFNTTNKSKIRSYLLFAMNRGFEDEVGFEVHKNWGHLRALAWRNTNFRIPDAFGNLLHLRYLNLSHCGMKNLPNSIVKLYNLKTLDISYCRYLNEWPKEFRKLVNLRHLYWDFCFHLKCMPVGMSKLSRLSRLTKFVVEDESASGMQRVGQLKDLRAIAKNLRGRIHIVFIENFKSADGYDWEGNCLEAAQQLTELEINFHFPPRGLDYVTPLQNKEKGGKEEIVMEKMKPNRNLKSFALINYSGEKIAGWGGARDNWATFLPYLMFIEVEYCELLQELPVLSKLKHLKSLLLRGLKNLEYMEEAVTDSIGLEFSGSRSLDATFFPALETLHLSHLENLKGWWRSGDSNQSHRQPAFPNLSDLVIFHCPRLVSFPPCLSLPKLELRGNSTSLRIRTANGERASSSILKLGLLLMFYLFPLCIVVCGLRFVVIL